MKNKNWITYGQSTNSTGFRKNKPASKDLAHVEKIMNQTVIPHIGKNITQTAFEYKNIDL